MVFKTTTRHSKNFFKLSKFKHFHPHPARKKILNEMNKFISLDVNFSNKL